MVRVPGNRRDKAAGRNVLSELPDILNSWCLHLPPSIGVGSLSSIRSRDRACTHVRHLRTGEQIAARYPPV